MCLNTLLPPTGYSAYRMAFGSNPADMFWGGGDDEDLLFAQGAPPSGQFAQKLKLRAAAQDAALKGMAISKMRSPLAHSSSFNGSEGDSAPSRRAVNRKSAPRRRFRTFVAPA